MVPSLLYTALTFIHELDKTEVLDALDAEITRLEGDIAYTRQGETLKVNAPGAPAFMAAIFANSRAHLEADLTLLRHLRATLPTAAPQIYELPTRDELRRLARQPRKAAPDSTEG